MTKPKGKGWKLIGNVGVDSGQLMVCDPTYIDSEWVSGQAPSGHPAMVLTEEGKRRFPDNKDWSWRYDSYGTTYESPQELLGGLSVNEAREQGLIKELPPMVKEEFSYRGCCDASLAGGKALPYKHSHDGVAVCGDLTAATRYGARRTTTAASSRCASSWTTRKSSTRSQGDSMSNCLQVLMKGEMPFHIDSDELAAVIGRISLPSLGLHIEWTPDKTRSVPNKHGGRTAMYGYEMMGIEAVSTKFLERFARLIKEEGGTVDILEFNDLEG